MERLPTLILEMRRASSQARMVETFTPRIWATSSAFKSFSSMSLCIQPPRYLTLRRSHTSRRAVPKMMEQIFCALVLGPAYDGDEFGFVLAPLTVGHRVIRAQQGGEDTGDQLVEVMVTFLLHVLNNTCPRCSTH